MYKTCIVAAAALLFSWQAQSRAGELAPGQTGSNPAQFEYNELLPLPFDGEVLASQAIPFEVSVDRPAGQFFQEGTFRQEVIRDSETGRLAFTYTVDPGAANATADLVRLVADGFGLFATDAYADVTFGPPLITRSADGNSITSVDSASPPRAGLAVLTDATAYALGGTTEITIHFQGNAAGGTPQRVTFGTYRPVPEPGTLSLPATVGVMVLRRWRRK